MSAITYERAARDIAADVDLRPESKEIKRLILDAERAAWQSGKWWGMYREFFINAVDNYLTLPSEVGTIIGININNCPAVVASRWFQFHQNGPGTLDECKQNNPNCMWTDRVVDMGEVAVFRDPQFEPVAVVSAGCEEPGTNITVSGHGEDCEPVYNFIKKNNDALIPAANTLCRVKERKDEIVTRYGEDIEVRHDQVTVSQTFWTSIVRIEKPVTRTPVEIYLVKKDGNMDLVARMAPHETSSCLRRYRLPDQCSGCRAVHVVAKVAEPQDISGGNQPLITPSFDALKNLVISADFAYRKRDLQQAEAYRSRAIRSLDEHLTEKRGDTVGSLQVVGPEVECHDQYQFGQDHRDYRRYQHYHNNKNK